MHEEKVNQLWKYQKLKGIHEGKQFDENKKNE